MQKHMEATVIEGEVMAGDVPLTCKKIAELEAVWRKADRQDDVTARPRDQHRYKKALYDSVTAVLVGLTFVWLAHGPVSAAESPYASSYDVIGQTERVLKRAASHSPQWHSRQEAIQRDIVDITFLLDQAVRASAQLNDAAKQEYAHQALTVLQRAVRHGHFDANSIEPVLTVIGELLPNIAA